jgi:integrase
MEIPTDDQVAEILTLACKTQRRAFGLMAYAGLRPNEVRALLRRDMKLRREENEAVGGFLSIREGRSFGETHTPKTGKREIPIARKLAMLLGEIEQGPREGNVALTVAGEPWGQYGLDRAFERVRDRAGFAGWSVYALRHYAITMWLRRGIPVHVVQKMAGHRRLSTSYVRLLGTTSRTPPGVSRKSPRGNQGVTDSWGEAGGSERVRSSPHLTCRNH